MAPYLPRNGQSGSPFSEGGALYALGLIYANHGHVSCSRLSRGTRCFLSSQPKGVFTVHTACISCSCFRNVRIMFLSIAQSFCLVPAPSVFIVSLLLCFVVAQDVRSFLLESLRATSNEVTQHGACLGLGKWRSTGPALVWVSY